MSPNGEHETASPNLRRGGEPWSDDEDNQLVQELRDGLDLDDIAGIHGRTTGAIRSRVSRMVPDDEDHPKSGKARVEWLREQLATGDYDWQTPLRSQASPLAWSTAEDDRLREGWERGTRLVELADTLRRSEPMLVRRLLQLRLAESLSQIVDRLGCDPNGPLALRSAIARGAAGPLVHVLLGVDDDGRPIHVSLHESAQAAHALSAAIDEQEDRVTKWQVVTRQVGGPGYADPIAGFQLRPDPDWNAAG